MPCSDEGTGNAPDFNGIQTAPLSNGEQGQGCYKGNCFGTTMDIDGNFVDDNTVRVNIKRLRQKMNDEKQEYIVTVFGMGYTFGE